MDARKLSAVLLALGALVTSGALVWWASFYGPITKELQANLSNAISCLYSTGGACSFVGFFVHIAGKTPYTPTVFWIGIGLLACGGIVRFALKK